jgi:protoheme IX farnesyltransferase
MKGAGVEVRRGTLPLDLIAAASAAGRRATAFISLTKPRLNSLVVATVAVGYCLGANARVDFRAIVSTLVGAALVAAGAAGLNQASERDTDRVMRRTHSRPLPGQRLSPSDAVGFSAVLSAAGLLLLATGANLIAAAIALATLVSYRAIYTPLKRQSTAAALVGAVPGALPPLIGWAAARGSLSIEAWTLFLIVFVWQIPHWLAIASMYHDDYERAGFPVLPVVEPDGRRTSRQVVLFAAALTPISIIPVLIHLAGPWYGAGALALGVGFFALSVGFARDRTVGSARQLFFGSIIYLPLLWGLLIADRVAF